MPKHAPPEFADHIKAGFRRGDLAALFAAQGYRRGAEIGVADGRFSLVLCQTIPDLHLLCVDPWRAYAGNPRGGPQAQQDRNYLLARERLAPYEVTFYRAMSVQAACEVAEQSLDFVYIDGHHGYDYVLSDLRAWSPRVRPGGMVSGHDFYHFRWAGVVEAVTEVIQQTGIQTWWLCDEREPSFWWVQP
jgi:predicted O-methyltransferase YrrM